MAKKTFHPNQFRGTRKTDQSFRIKNVKLQKPAVSTRVNDSAPDPSPELSFKKMFFNPFNLADRIEEAKRGENPQTTTKR